MEQNIDQNIDQNKDQEDCCQKAILFDLDGTLLDTHELILASFRYAYATVLGTELVPSDSQITNLIGIPLDTQFKQLAPKHAEELAAVYREHNRRIHDSMVKPFAGMSEVLEELEALNVRMAVVTSKRHALAWHGLELFDYTKYFEFLIGVDDCEKHKPDPAPLLLAAKRLNLTPDQCIYVGDSPYDMQAARSANMLAVGVEWGMFSAESLHCAGAQQIVSDPQGLLLAHSLVAACCQQSPTAVNC